MKTPLFILTIVTFISCGPKDPYYIDHQSLRKKDKKGRQGFWYDPLTYDTVIFLNDTGHTLGSLTSGELIRYMRQYGHKNLKPISDSMNKRIW